MKQLFGIVLAGLLCLGRPAMAWSQYALEELGVEMGPGITLFQNSSENALGLGANANAFYSHYACGKAYGFHLTAGAAAFFPSTGNGERLIDEPIAGTTNLQFVNLDFGVLGKIRLHEYHRPHEWAVFLGPKLQVPLVAHASTDGGTGSLDQSVRTVNRIWPGVQLSMQFRRPASKKKSWFIHPGVEYYFLPAFSSTVAGDVKPLYFFLNFGFAFWDLRG